MSYLEHYRQFLIPVLFSLLYIIGYFVVIKFSKIIDHAREKEEKIPLTPLFKSYLIFWIFLSVVITFLPVLNLKTNIITITEKIVLILFILSLTALTDKIISVFIKSSFTKFSDKNTSVSLLYTIVKITVYTVGSLLVFHVLGVSIAPILTALGVGGLAVSLALQDTLANLFSGIHIIFSKQVRVGDYIKLDTGEEGYVDDINWRDTTIRQLQNNIIIVPNKNMVSAKVINFYLPRTETTILVDVGVSYDSDLEFVEKVTIEVAREVMEEVEGGVSDFEPFVRYKEFGDSSINFSVILRAKEYANRYLLKHEFIKRLHKRYNEEGIDIPFPITTVYMENKREEKNNENK